MLIETNDMSTVFLTKIYNVSKDDLNLQKHSKMVMSSQHTRKKKKQEKKTIGLSDYFP